MSPHRRDALTLTLVLALASLTTSAGAQAPSSAPKPLSPKEAERRQLLEQMGLRKADRSPQAPGAAPAAAPASSKEASGPARGPEEPGPHASSPERAATSAPGLSFRRIVHPLLIQTCRACHGAGGPAAATRLVLSGDAAADHASVARLITTTDPAQSLLLTKASGSVMHAGGSPWPEGSAAHTRVLAWIKAGGRLDGLAASAAPPPATRAEPKAPPLARTPGAVATAPESAPEAEMDANETTDDASPPEAATATAPTATPTSSGAPSPTLASATTPSPGPTPPPHGAVGQGALRFPGGFSLNGRFDLDYERRGFSGDPLANGATNALRSYHHFLFLSRESTGDPFGLSLEMLSLLFWEAHVRWAPRGRAIQVTLAGGKILVPFGADPLFHQSYGGHTGFDQRILPVVWAQEGVAAHVLWQRRAVALTDDLYVVRGYGLRQANGVLNLQSDLSPADDARLAWGNRLGAAWGPLSLWYSALFNMLGFGRRLFMQAADITLWRLRGVPVLEHVSLAAGLLRADVSGGGAGIGGPGQDYYHFGSYFQLRVHPTDWLYFQYRQGVRTFNNRRGLWIDDTRLTSDDGSTHNFAVVARDRGFTASVAWFFNLEKTAEIPDDLLRVSLTYEF
jgi:hypothetical protein